MPKLMLAVAASNLSAPVARIGGLPTAAPTFAWPRCSTCHGPMQFLAQLPLAETGIKGLERCNQLLLLFQCQNDPGMCDEWEPDSGGNAAIRVPIGADLAPVPPPALSAAERARGLAGPTVLRKVEGIVLEDYDESEEREMTDGFYFDNAYDAALADTSRAVVGKVGGRPIWLQGDETPRCSCGRRMVFVAQIEFFAGGGINFGDTGTGYAFACTHCDTQARFLWQCL